MKLYNNDNVCRLGGFIIALCLCFGVATAKNNKIIELEERVVVATRTPLPDDNVSPSVNIAGNEEMELWKDQTVADTLRRMPGTVLVKQGGLGSTTALFTRGTESNHTSVYLDGRRLSPGFGDTFDFEYLGVDNLSSVQMMRGPSSVNYGSDAIGGVIDLRTRSAFKEKGYRFMAEGEYGSFQYHRTKFEAEGSTENIAMSLGGNFLETDNQRQNNKFEYVSLLPRAELRIGKYLTADVLSMIYDADLGVPGSRAAPKPRDYQKNLSWLLSPGLTYVRDRVDFQLYYLHADNKVRSQTTGAFGAFSENEVWSDEFSGQVNVRPVDDLLLSFGGLYRNDHAKRRNLLTATTAYENNFSQTSTYIHSIWEACKFIELRQGVRWDGFSDFQKRLTGTGELIVKWPSRRLSAFAKIANSYAPPSALDYAFDSDRTNTPPQPEEADSWEVGVRHKPQIGWLPMEWSALYFRNNMQNLVDFNQVTFDTFNVGTAMTEGVELSMSMSPHKSLTLGFQYSYMTAIEKGGGTGFTQNSRLLRRPRFMIGLNALYKPLDKLSLGVHVNGVFGREDTHPVTFNQVDGEDYYAMRAVVEYEFYKDWAVFGRVENLLDDKYDEAMGFPVLDRAAYVGVRMRF